MLQKKIIDEDVKEILNTNLPWERLYEKTVLISGANGYVPAYLVHTLLALNDYKNAGIRVLALCRNEKHAKNRFADYADRDDLKLLIQNVCEPIDTDEKVNIYIHAASPAGIRTRHLDPVETFLSNVKGCENMLQSAVKNPCEAFLLISSVDIYGSMSNTNRLRETDVGILDSMNVRNAYSCGKRAAETLCSAFFAKYQLPVYVVRPFQIVGPGPELNDGRLHIDFISQMLNGNQIVLKSDGSAKRTFMYITDAVLGMLTVMLKGDAGQAYNVVDEKGEATVLELADLMASLVRNRKVDVVFDYDKRNMIEVTGALSVVTGCSDKLVSLGWYPQLTLRQGVERMMRYYGVTL